MKPSSSFYFGTIPFVLCVSLSCADFSAEPITIFSSTRSLSLSPSTQKERDQKKAESNSKQSSSLSFLHEDMEDELKIPEIEEEIEEPIDLQLKSYVRSSPPSEPMPAASSAPPLDLPLLKESDPDDKPSIPQSPKPRTLKNTEGLFSNLRVFSTNIINQDVVSGGLVNTLNLREQSHLKSSSQQSKSFKKENNFVKKKDVAAQSNPYSNDFEKTQRRPIDHYLTQGRPAQFWPKKGYFKNTYLGGNLSYHEALRQTSSTFKTMMTYSHGIEWTPPLDPPHDVGITLNAELSHTFVDQPRRVILQLGLKGSERYGWRRPALNMMISVDPSLLTQSSLQEERQSSLVELILPILKRLNPADQVGLSLGRVSISPRSPEQLKEALIEPLKHVMDPLLVTGDWSRSIIDIGKLLNQSSADPHRAPGAQAILMICGQGCISHFYEIKNVVHRLNLDGTLTSVIDHRLSDTHVGMVNRSSSLLWQIAEAGHGGFWLSRGFIHFKRAVNHEFDRFSRVVARLLRLNIKLQEGVELIEVIGSEMLNQKQKKLVKAREEAMDQKLSTRLGITADRGGDDEGVQVVIPAFYGGDSHLIHLSLWVTKPGQVAEITLKYKDMVRAQNASHSRSVHLGALTSPLTLAHQEVRQGADQHLMADQILSGVGHKSSNDILSMVKAFTQGTNLGRSLSHQETILLSRARLGRPQSALKASLTSDSL